MALIKCPECGHEVSDLAPHCPSCGVAIAGNIVICPDCGKVLLKKEKTCPNCGCVLDASEAPAPRKAVSAYQYARAEEPAPSAGPRKERSSAWKVVMVIVIVLAAAGGGLYFYMNKIHEEQVAQAYNALQSSFDISEYEQFLADYPDSPYNNEVKSRLEMLKNIRSKWTEIALSPSKNDFVQFLADYPHSAFDEACKSKIDSFDWVDATTENTALSYQKYIDEHSSGRYIAEAKAAKENIDRMTVSYPDKYAVRSLVASYLSALTANDTEALSAAAAGRLYDESVGFMAKLHGENVRVSFAAVTPVQVSKAPNPNTEFVYIAKCAVERSLLSKSGETVNTLYNAIYVVSPEKRIISARMKPAEE